MSTPLWGPEKDKSQLVADVYKRQAVGGENRRPLRRGNVRTAMPGITVSVVVTKIAGNIGAVSYTHLDVYKRQALLSSPASVWV